MTQWRVARVWPRTGVSRGGRPGAPGFPTVGVGEVGASSGGLPLPPSSTRRHFDCATSCRGNRKTPPSCGGISGVRSPNLIRQRGRSYLADVVMLVAMAAGCDDLANRQRKTPAVERPPPGSVVPNQSGKQAGTTPRLYERSAGYATVIRPRSEVGLDDRGPTLAD
jgi:hypothetical protein